jgi:hypothetical protein
LSLSPQLNYSGASARFKTPIAFNHLIVDRVADLKADKKRISELDSESAKGGRGNEAKYGEAASIAACLM